MRCASPSRRAQEQTSWPCCARHAASEARATRVCAAALAQGTPAATCRPKRNEDVGPRRRRPLRGVEPGHPDAVVTHDRVVVRIGQGHRALRHWPHRSSARPRDRRVSPPRRAAVPRGNHGAERRVFIEQRVPARHASAARRCATRARHASRAGAKRASSARRPLGRRACARYQASRAPLQPRARATAAGDSPWSCVRATTASSSALKSSLPRLAQSRFDGGAREDSPRRRETAVAASAPLRRNAAGP